MNKILRSAQPRSNADRRADHPPCAGRRDATEVRSNDSTLCGRRPAAHGAQCVAPICE